MKAFKLCRFKHLPSTHYSREGSKLSVPFGNMHCSSQLVSHTVKETSMHLHDSWAAAQESHAPGPVLTGHSSHHRTGGSPINPPSRPLNTFDHPAVSTFPFALVGRRPGECATATTKKQFRIRKAAANIAQQSSVALLPEPVTSSTCRCAGMSMHVWADIDRTHVNATSECTWPWDGLLVSRKIPHPGVMVMFVGLRARKPRPHSVPPSR